MTTLVENLAVGDIVKRYGWAYIVRSIRIEGDDVKLKLELAGSDKPLKEMVVKKGTTFKVGELKIIDEVCNKCNGTGFTGEFKVEGLSIFCVCEAGQRELRKFIDDYKGESKEQLKFLKQTEREISLGWLGIMGDKAYICWTLSLDLKYGTLKIKTVGDWCPLLTKYDSEHLEAEISI